MLKQLKLGSSLLVVVAFAAAHSAYGEPVIDACVTNPNVLGLSRIVEIDTQGGPQFGSGHSANDFLADHEVVLTFDDGPLRTFTRPVLKALADHCTKATFFMVGRMANSDPAMVKEVAAQGHTVASHTFSHQNLKPIGLLKGRKEFEMGISAVTKAKGGPIAPFFRFPFLSESRPVIEYAKSRNVGIFSIDIDPKDFQTRNGDEVHRRVMSQLAMHKKGIILLHDIQPSTAHALKGLLDDLHKKGFKVVHMVPKSPVETIANFDGAAPKDGDSKSEPSTAISEPKRSVELTMSPAAAVVGKNGKALAKVAPVASPASETPTSAPDAPEVLPWNAQDEKKPPESGQKPKRVNKPKSGDSSWLMNIFGN